MRNITRTAACSAILLATSLASALAADPTGDWRDSDGFANIRVAECNGSMWGVVVWEKDPGGHDTKNPDVSKRNRPNLGMPVLINMKKKPAADQWEGQVYNAKDGQIYSAKIRPTGADQLEIRGCVLGVLCGGETWTRVAGPIPASPVNSPAKETSKTAAASSKTSAAPATSAPRTVGSVTPAPGTTDRKTAAADPVGDICLLPDIARFTH
jgi:uncharacterized protein (DUF2147 family)